MLPGPDYIYKCPKCSSLLKIGSLMSGNTCGAKLFSDGKQIAPMLPDFPNLTKCKKCDTIFWLSNLKEIGTCNAWDEEYKPEWKKADRANFLDITDLFRCLEMDSVKNHKKEEKDVRIQIWWTYNDRIRENKKIFVQEKDEVLWKQNCIRLIELLDESDVNQKIMAAELHRNLGEFDVCMKLINSLDNNLDWVIEKFKTECEKGNKSLVQIY